MEMVEIILEMIMIMMVLVVKYDLDISSMAFIYCKKCGELNYLTLIAGKSPPIK
jgi:hypothetical protein